MNTKRKLNIWLPLLLGITMATGIFFGFKLSNVFPREKIFVTDRKRPVDEVLSLIKNKYVDSVNIGNLSDTAIVAMLMQLDPHSQFIPAKMVEAVNDDIAGNFYGIGIEYDIFNDTMNVLQVIPGGPAEEAGMQMGDKIIQAGDSLMAGQHRDASEMRDILKGNRGSELIITVIRNNQKISLKVKRDYVSVSSIDASYMISPGIGYIYLSKFTQQAYREFMIALDTLNKAGMKKLILDLRDNGGGVLEEAVEIADEFLSGDKLITYTEGLHVPKKEYRCRRTGQFETGELVVLCNGSTASASEILLGALQDWDRATIIGGKTFGKGLVQEQYSLSDGSALRLTISRYFTPLGRSIQRTYKKGIIAYYAAAESRLENPDTSSIEDNKKFYTTPSGKKLYGGGGISPDIYGGKDSLKLTYNLALIYSSKVIRNYAYSYSVKNRQVLMKWGSPENYNNHFEVNKEMLHEFDELISKDSLGISIEDLEKEEIIQLQRSIKVSIARQLWRSEGFYEIMNRDDVVINQALEVLKK